MSIAEPILSDHYFFLQGISWQTYLDIRESRDNSHIRMTFNRGRLEMMAPSKRHEHFGYFLGRLIDVWTEERNIDVQSCRTMTFKREDLLRGLEPDNCYYLAHEPAIRNKDELDFTVDPPPDLAIEIDLSGYAVEKLEIYAAFGVPEVWRYDGRRIFVHLLEGRGDYADVSESVCLPGIPLREIEKLMQTIGSTSDTRLVKEFRMSVRAKS
jgi:Uma2 family endonuclease